MGNLVFWFVIGLVAACLAVVLALHDAFARLDTTERQIRELERAARESKRVLDQGAA